MTDEFDELFARHDGAFAKATLKSYKSDFRCYCRWCEQNGVAPFEPTVQDIANYVEFQAETCCCATVTRRLTTLATVFRLKQLEDPTVAPVITLALKRMFRKKGRAQKQAIPLTHNVLDDLMAVCGESNRKIRDQVMLLLGYETMCRATELCRFRFDDIEVLQNGKVGIRLIFFKTDQMGRGKLIGISAEFHTLLQRWRERVGGDGLILRSVDAFDNIGESLHSCSIKDRLRELQERAKLDLGGPLGSYSFRMGATRDMLDNGDSLTKIMLRGGWPSQSAAMRYLRDWQLVR
ncbi:MAG: integrase [Gammaproteobacteria bacterium]|nr:MAG: integrase [Gammaproteobacteria bacterium]